MILLNIGVDVDWRFDIFKSECDDKLFTLLNIDVGVDWRFAIFRFEYVDNEFIIDVHIDVPV